MCTNIPVWEVPRVLHYGCKLMECRISLLQLSVIPTGYGQSIASFFPRLNSDVNSPTPERRLGWPGTCASKRERWVVWFAWAQSEPNNDFSYFTFISWSNPAQGNQAFQGGRGWRTMSLHSTYPTSRDVKVIWLRIRPIQRLAVDMYKPVFYHFQKG